MSQQQPRYPRWYIGVMCLMYGFGLGVLLVPLLVYAHVLTLDGSWGAYVLPFAVNGLAMFVTAFCEIGFGVQRYRRASRAARSSPAAT